MAIEGKYTNDHTGYHIGQRNDKNKLHGLGFVLDTSTRAQTNGSVHIGTYQNGKQADVGGYIHISKGGQIRVGEHYKNSKGQVKGKGMMYKVNG